MKKLYSSFFKSNIIKNVSSIVGATLVAQIIGVVIFPLLSRIYSPAEFGVLSVYTSVVSILTMFTGLRYYLAVPLPKHKRYALALFYVTLVAHVAFAVLLLLLAFCGGSYFLEKFRLSSLQPYLYLIPLGVFTTGLYTIVTQWAVREGFFYTIGLTRIVQALSGNVTKLAMGFAGYKPIGLLLGAIIAQSCGSSTIIKRSLRDIPLIHVSRTDIKRVIVKYRNFPLYDMWTAVINVVGQNMPQLFLLFYYSLNTVGLYTMAASLLSLPISLVGSAIGQVFVQRGAQAKYEGTLSDFSRKSYKIMLTLSIYPIGLISLLGPSLFSFFLGRQWSESGMYAIMLFPRVAYSMTYGPICMLYAISDKIKDSFYHEILLTIVMLVGLYLGNVFKNPLVAVLVYSVLSLIVMMLRMTYILNVVGIKVTEIFGMTFSVFIETAFLLFIPAFILLFSMPMLFLMLSAFISAVAYLTLNYYKFRKEGIV
ncbi:lipopolysaccharide biosynthesis protein [Cloacibacillus sp.]